MIPAHDFKFVMSQKGLYDGPTSGSLNGACLKAAHDAIQQVLAHMPEDWQDWPNSRVMTGAVQAILLSDGINPGPVDGYYGHLTADAVDTYRDRLTENPMVFNRPDEDEPQSKPTKTDWPNSSGLVKYFGEPGGNACTAGVIKLPFAMKLAWDLRTSVSTIKCHERVAVSGQKVFDKIAEAYDQPMIEMLGLNLFGGCFNHRLKRGGTTLSVHSFGAAIDFDPLRNGLRWGKDRAFLARPEAEEFWRIWESEKWVSLGRTRNFDWMHVQAVNL
jgi:hypothetical protein